MGLQVWQNLMSILIQSQKNIYIIFFNSNTVNGSVSKYKNFGYDEE